MPGLAVLTPFVGLPSETFVQRHVTELAPGRTLTVTTRMTPPAAPVWRAPAPAIVLDGRRERAVERYGRHLVAAVRGRPRGVWRWQPSHRDLDVLARALDDADVEVALVEFLDVFLPLVPWLRERGLRVFAHAHGYDVSTRLRSPWWQAQYAAYRDVEGVIAVSEHVKRRLVGTVGLDPARVAVLPCGVDVAETPPVRSEHGDTVEVVAVGRLVAKKDPLTTIEAFRRAVAEVPALRLTMVGDGPLLEEARATVDRNGIGDRVALLGARPHADALALLHGADVFAQHSVVAPNGDEEGLPVGVLEAMAAAVPVVSTHHAGIPEAVEEGVTGLLVQEGDVDGMAAALVELGRDPARRRALGRAGHARALERFSWQRERRDKRALLGLDGTST